MPIITWNDSLSVNVDEIDEQHKILIKIINRLFDAMKEGKGTQVIGRTVEELHNYTISHFGSEERYFDQFNYPDAANHKKQHAIFVKKIEDLKADLVGGKTGIPIDVLNFLSDWLTNHIKGTDKKYSHLFNEKGLK